MKITKFGHCCLLVEEGDARLLTDPGNYSVTPSVENVDAILITHEHQDHLHIPALQAVLAANPKARVISHAGVGKILVEEGVAYEEIKDGEEISVNGVAIASHGHEHACICHGWASVQNTGFFIAGRLFYPGDAFHDPGKQVEILALPVAGPWMKLEEAIDYAVALKPAVVFPVHDGMLVADRRGPTRRIPSHMLAPHGIAYEDMNEGDTKEF